MSEDGRVGVLEVTYGVAAADLTAAARGTLQQSFDGARRTEKVAEVGGDAVEEDPELGYAAVSPLTDT